MTTHDLNRRPTVKRAAAEDTTTAPVPDRGHDRPDIAQPMSNFRPMASGAADSTLAAEARRRSAPGADEGPSSPSFGSMGDDGPRFPRFTRAVRRTQARGPGSAPSAVSDDDGTPDFAPSAGDERPAPRIRRVQRVSFLILAISIPWVGYHFFKEAPPAVLSTDPAAVGDRIASVDPMSEDVDPIVVSSALALSASDGDDTDGGRSAAPYEHSSRQSFSLGVSVAAAANLPRQERLVAPYEHSSSGKVSSSITQARASSAEQAGRSAKSAVLGAVERASTVTGDPERTVDTATLVELTRPDSAADAHEPPSSVTTAVAADTGFASVIHRVQLGSFGSDQRVKDGWVAFREKLEPLLDFVDPYFQVAEIGGATWHRLQVGPFATYEGAGSFCAEIRRRGFDCFVVRGTESGSGSAGIGDQRMAQPG